MVSRANTTCDHTVLFVKDMISPMASHSDTTCDYTALFIKDLVSRGES